MSKVRIPMIAPAKVMNVTEDTPIDRLGAAASTKTFSVEPIDFVVAVTDAEMDNYKDKPQDFKDYMVAMATRSLAEALTEKENIWTVDKTYDVERRRTLYSHRIKVLVD